jgi:hypothetical protein
MPCFVRRPILSAINSKEYLMRKIVASVALASQLGVALSFAASEPPKVTPESMSALVAKIKPPDGAGWAKIPWVATLEGARKASRDEQAPVFLFVLDGNLASGRC